MAALVMWIVMRNKHILTYIGSTAMYGKAARGAFLIIGWKTFHGRTLWRSAL